MKKQLIWLLAAVMTLSLFGCGGESTEAPTESTEAVDLSEKVYADYLTDNGYIKDVTAKDCVSEADFSKLTVSKADMEAKAKEYADGYMDYIAEHFSEQKKDRAVENGDKVNIDYSGSVDGVKFDGGTAADQQVTAGSQEFIDDFLTQIIGHMPGETIDVVVSFPDSYPQNQSLAGKEAVFVTTINYIYEKPELTDEYIAEHREAIEEYTRYDNITDYKTLYDKGYAYYEDYVLENLLYEALQKYDVVTKVPENAYNYAYVSLNKNYQTNYGVTLKDLLGIGYTAEQIQSMVVGEAKIEILLQVIYEEENYQVTEADFKEVTETNDNTEYIKNFGTGYISRYVMFDRAIEFLKKKVQIQ